MKPPVPPRRPNLGQTRPARRKAEVNVAKEPVRKPDSVRLLASKEPQNEIKARLVEKEKASRRSIITRISVVVGVVLVLLVALWFVFFSSVFALRESTMKVESDTDGLDLEPAISQVTGVVGEPLLRINTRALKQRILENPQYLDVDISRRWPDGLDVTVVARQPIFSVVNDKKFDLVAADGIKVRQQAEVEPGTTEIQLATKDGLTPSQTTEIKTVVDALDPSLAEQVRVVSYNAGLITLQLHNGTRIVWGGSKDSKVKNQVVALLIANRGASIYDVTDPTRPSVR